MPGFDRSGPMGAGPMTGGGRGLCNTGRAGNRPFGGPGFGRGPGLGRGFRGSRGFRAGYGWGAAAPYSGYPEDTADELNMLQSQLHSIQESIEAIREKMAGLEKSAE
ncbi:MAG: DUF5320 domain-containing protein [Desulfosalsimonadaceae bacterium]